MRTLTPEQRVAQQARQEKFKAIVKQVASMTEEERSQLLRSAGAVVTVDGRPLSPQNTCLLITQFPGVSLVGGFRQWLAQGRCVRKGQHGLMIWVPLRRKGRPVEHMDVENGEDQDAVPRPAGPKLLSEGRRFIVGTVFDVSQTVEVRPENPERPIDLACVFTEKPSSPIELNTVAFPAWRRAA